jgi:hypothetical protein
MGRGWNVLLKVSGAEEAGWNIINGMESNVVSMCLIPFHLFHSSHYNDPVHHYGGKEFPN